MASLALSVEGITKHYGPEPVLAGVAFELREGEHVALVGPNGAGKTTLLRIVAGGEEADSGCVTLHGGATLGVLEQQPRFDPRQTLWDEARAALDEILSFVAESERIAHALAAAPPEEHARLSKRFDWLHHELERRGGYHVDHKIERVLHGLGFPSESFQQPVGQLSGGQLNRLLLAKLLISEPDVLVLDEPSNHLDIEATEWLEEFLVESKQAVLLVSHDRYLLDRVATRTLELVRGTIDSFPGNFSAYRRQKAERLEVQRRTYERQQTEIAKMEEFIRRMHYGDRHAQAEDRRKKLERIERVDPPREIEAPAMSFPPASRTGDIVLRVEGLAKSFDRPLFRNLTFDLLRGEKWGILGPNGTGKTTLLKCLVGQCAADAGRVILGSGVRVGYCDQRLECVADDLPVVEAVRPAHREFVEQQRRDLLARFGLVGDQVFQPIRSLSGGERNRAALARLAAMEPNVLVLDEPTNHLDLWARESLEKALREFDGTLFCVSHDRYFLNQVVDHLLVVEHDRFRIVEGNYDTYLHLVKQGLAGGGSTAPAESAKRSGAAKSTESTDPNGRRETKPEKRKRKFPYRKVADLEAEILGQETRLQELQASLADPDVLRDGARVKQCKAELGELQSALAVLYEHWTEAVELN